MSTNVYVIKDYENETYLPAQKNKPKTNPIKACPELLPKVRSRMGQFQRPISAQKEWQENKGLVFEIFLIDNLKSIR